MAAVHQIRRVRKVRILNGRTTVRRTVNVYECSMCDQQLNCCVEIHIDDP